MVSAQKKRTMKPALTLWIYLAYKGYVFVTGAFVTVFLPLGLGGGQY